MNLNSKNFIDRARELINKLDKKTNIEIQGQKDNFSVNFKNKSNGENCILRYEKKLDKLQMDGEDAGMMAEMTQKSLEAMTKNQDIITTAHITVDAQKEDAHKISQAFADKGMETKLEKPDLKESKDSKFTLEKAAPEITEQDVSASSTRAPSPGFK